MSFFTERNGSNWDRYNENRVRFDIDPVTGW